MKKLGSIRRRAEASSDAFAKLLQLAAEQGVSLEASPEAIIIETYLSEIAQYAQTMIDEQQENLKVELEKLADAQVTIRYAMDELERVRNTILNQFPSKQDALKHLITYKPLPGKEI